MHDRQIRFVIRDTTLEQYLLYANKLINRDESVAMLMGLEPYLNNAIGTIQFCS